MQTRDVRGQKMPTNANVICESSLMLKESNVWQNTHKNSDWFSQAIFLEFESSASDCFTRFQP